MTDQPDAVILLSRGGTSAAAREQLQQLADTMQQRGAAAQVLVAFIDRASRSLPEALDLCRDARCVAVVPLLTPDEPALQRWLHKVAMRWRAANDGNNGAALPRIVFAPALMAAARLPELAQAQIALAVQAEDVAETVGEQWQQDPAAWSVVPEHQHHLLMCAGPRCTSRGAVAVWQRLGECLKDAPELKRRVMPLQTGCQSTCNHGPMAIVYPEGVWYGRLDAHNLPQVLQTHFIEGQTCTPHVVHRPAPAAIDSDTTTT